MLSVTYIGCDAVIFWPLPNATVEETLDLVVQYMIVCRQA